MDDLISRQAAIDALIELTIQRDKWDDKEGFAQKRGIDAAICAIEDLPSAERRGRWIETGMLYRDTRGINSLFYGKRCSVCNEISDYKPHYCPNCGAKMEV